MQNSAYSLSLIYCLSPTDALLTINNLQKDPSVFSSIWCPSKLFELLDFFEYLVI